MHCCPRLAFIVHPGLQPIKVDLLSGLSNCPLLRPNNYSMINIHIINSILYEIHVRRTMRDRIFVRRALIRDVAW